MKCKFILGVHVKPDPQSMTSCKNIIIKTDYSV